MELHCKETRESRGFSGEVSMEDGDDVKWW